MSLPQQSGHVATLIVCDGPNWHRSSSDQLQLRHWRMPSAGFQSAQTVGLSQPGWRALRSALSSGVGRA